MSASDLPTPENSNYMKNTSTFQYFQPKDNSANSLSRVSADDDSFIQLQELVKASGLYNFEYCQIPLNTKLNIPFFRFMLSDYKDKHVCELLEYGFPIGFSGKVQ